MQHPSLHTHTVVHTHDTLMMAVLVKIRVIRDFQLSFILIKLCEQCPWKPHPPYASYTFCYPYSLVVFSEARRPYVKHVLNFSTCNFRSIWDGFIWCVCFFIYTVNVHWSEYHNIVVDIINLINRNQTEKKMCHRWFEKYFQYTIFRLYIYRVIYKEINKIMIMFWERSMVGEGFNLILHCKKCHVENYVFMRVWYLLCCVHHHRTYK